MPIYQDKAAAQVKRAMMEEKRNRDDIYVKILMMLGFVSLAMSVIMIVARDMVLNPQIIAMLCISVTLLAMGALWQWVDKHRVDLAQEEFERLETKEMSGMRVR